MAQQILMAGLNHATAPIRLREEVALATRTRAGTAPPLATQLDPSLFPERLILSTCNRTEIYVVTVDRVRGESSLRDVFATPGRISAANDIGYAHFGRGAAAHLFAVSSGIDSAIVGESEILGQVRRAYSSAVEEGTVGPILHRLLGDAIHTGKRARAETAIGAGAASVASAAVALARRRIGRLEGLNVLVIGAGEMAHKAARNLTAAGAGSIAVVNRTLDHAKQIANDVGGVALTYSELPDALAQADLVISATAAPHPILDSPAVESAMKGRARKPLFIFDIAVPRDVDPRAAEIPNVRLFNIDDLNQLVLASRSDRENEVGKVEAIIDEEVDRFWAWYVERRAAPIIAGLRRHAESIRAAEVDKAVRRLGHLQLAERDLDVIAALSEGIVGRMLAAPTARLKERVASGDGQAYLDLLSELFQLAGNDED